MIHFVTQNFIWSCTTHAKLKQHCIGCELLELHCNLSEISKQHKENLLTVFITSVTFHPAGRFSGYAILTLPMS